MKKLLIVALSLLTIGQSFGRENAKNSNVTASPVVCYASGKSHKSFIGTPVHLKNADGKTANIVVDYIGFSDAAQEAFQYAVDIWKNLVYSPFPIHVQANWTSLEPGVLGSSRPADMVSNFEGTEILNYDYPIALAEKIAGKELNASGSYEIIASFNKDLSSWYLGTDGNCPANKYDFVTVVLHELTHGLGFTGNFYSNTRARGGYSYLSDNLAAVFDEHVVNKDGNQLVNTSLFPNPSVILNSNLISGWLNFDTDLLNGALPRLYAPTKWDAGSSIYHLDEDTYLEENANSLMTPFSNAGEVVHDPGPYTMAVMFDIGWKWLTVMHKKVNDIETATSPVVFDVDILSDYGIDTEKLYLIYSPNKFSTKDSVLLKPVAGTDKFSVSVQFPQSGTKYYYFSAADSNGKRYIYPSGSPSSALSFKIGADTEAPAVSLSPVKYLMDTDPQTKIVVTATDNLGIKSVNIEYFLNGGSVKTLELTNDSNDIYSGMLAFEPGTVKDGDIVSYRVVATDASSNANTKRDPVSGYNTFRIEGFKSPVEVYSNDFNTQFYDFITGDFTISTPSGFSNPALNSAHPYQSPEVDNGSFNFSTILKYPVILKSGSRMSFDEIVLVEPGDDGTAYGEENFYDYVIIEGSKDNGVTWLPLVDGYDCTAQKSWVDLYNSSISEQNSTATPTKDFYVARDFGLLGKGNFAAGDTILVRFRLFSDPYANGWGWIIDNLKIYDDGTSVTASVLSPGEVLLYPNPAKDQINLDIQARNSFRNLTLKAYNASGSQVFNQTYAVGSNLFRTTVDVNSFKTGLYLFVIESENGIPLTRKILIN